MTIPPPQAVPGLPLDAHDVIVLGGTFDPPQHAHAALAQAARAQAAPDAWLIVIPAARSPHKEGPPGASDADRLAMLHLTLAGIARAAVWEDELRRPAPSYTVETLARLRTVLASSTTVHLLIGADQAIAFHRWREPRSILAAARVLVLPRAPVLSRESLLASLRGEHFWTGPELDRWAAAWLPLSPLPENASAIRVAISRGGVDAVPPGWLNQDVAAYIRRQGLYAPPGAEVRSRPS